MTLATLQRDMRAWLTEEDGAAAARLGPDAAAGLGVYLNNYRGNLAACLEDSFAQTLRWIGGEEFHRAVVAHVARVPPSSWTLDAYARDFPATLALLYPADPEVVELARLELALGEAFVGEDAEPIAADAIGDLDWDRAVLTFTPTLDLTDLTTNAPAIWTALVEAAPVPGVELLDEPGAILVWRQGEHARFRAIDAIERQALARMRARMPFGALCTALVELEGETQGVARAGQLLGQWLTDGLIVAVCSAGDDDTGQARAVSARPART